MNTKIVEFAFNVLAKFKIGSYLNSLCFNVKGYIQCTRYTMYNLCIKYDVTHLELKSYVVRLTYELKI